MVAHQGVHLAETNRQVHPFKGPYVLVGHVDVPHPDEAALVEGLGARESDPPYP
jgi:hypothetical protein